MEKSYRVRSAIDIGTNTVLLLVAEQCEQTLTPIYEAQEIPRLGRGVDSNKTLSEDSIDRVMNALMKYKTILETSYPNCEPPIVTATSAVRDASNRNEFITKVKKELGFDIRLLSGNDEAEWTFAGALSVLPSNIESPVCVLDIGGGSTELAYGKGTYLLKRNSFDMGSVRYTERFLKETPISTKTITETCEYIKSEFRANTEIASINEQFIGIGVAGTVSTLAFLEHGFSEYDAKSLNGLQLSLSFVDQKIQEWSKMNSDDLEKCYPVVLKGRADIILAGLLILKSFMNYFQLNELLVSTGGIRHGALLKTF
jgi:exopolyphosphatase/guanosine-5'-triphosphate,3'-diphosphate pyrophosphatase